MSKFLYCVVVVLLASAYFYNKSNPNSSLETFLIDHVEKILHWSQHSLSFIHQQESGLPPALPSNPKNEESQHNLPSKLNSDKINKIAKTVTVSILNGDELSGSGVIIGQTNHHLYILTAHHVIGIRPGKIEVPYEVVTSDGQKFEIDYNNYPQIVHTISKDIDLAVLELKSTNRWLNQDRMVVELTDSVIEGMDVYLFGYLPCPPSKKEKTLENSQVGHLSLGQTGGVKSLPKKSEYNYQIYDIDYNTNTVQGMSGSPVFDAAGRLIAIHTASDQHKIDLEECSLPSKPNPEYGQNRGVSMKHLIDNKSKLPSDLQSILKVSSLPVSGVKPEVFDPELLDTVGPFVGKENSESDPNLLNNCGPFIDPKDCPGNNE